MTLTMKKKNIKNLSLAQCLDANKTAYIAAGAVRPLLEEFSKGPVTCRTQ